MQAYMSLIHPVETLVLEALSENAAFITPYIFAYHTHIYHDCVNITISGLCLTRKKIQGFLAMGVYFYDSNLMKVVESTAENGLCSINGSHLESAP